MENKRYVVTDPVPGGYAWFDVVDTKSTVMPNFAIASIFRDAPGAHREAYDLCDRLNEVSK